MRIVDEELLEKFRSKTTCEWCKKLFLSGLDPHHVHSKGAGRLDIQWNLIALCRRCHSDVHDGRILRDDLLAVVAAREGVLQDEIRQKIWDLRRA